MSTYQERKKRCLEKKGYDNKKQAYKARETIKYENPLFYKAMTIYKCPFCGKYKLKTRKKLPQDINKR